MGLFSLASKSVKELVDLGYPESVAKKIADGTLPMDEASREARASLMGMTDDRFLRGHSANSRPQSNEDMFMVKVEQDGDFPGSKAYGVAESYARGGEVYDEALDDYIELPGEVTPLRHNANNLFHVDVGGDDYSGALASPPGWQGQMRVGSDEIASAVKGYTHETGLQGTRFEDMVDYYDNNASDGHATDIYNVLGSRPDVDIRHADLAAFDPDYNGSNILGGSLLPIAGLLAAGQSEDADAGFVTRGGKTLLEAWHGSPHKFDRFSMDQIGTGEGAQAYGHGLYFADSEDLARGYKSKLEKGGGLSDDDTIARVLNSVDGDAEKAVAELRRRGNTSLQGETPENAKRFFQMAQKVSGGYDPRGALYRTEIDVTPESLLDWDKPLSEQSEAVRGAIDSLDPLTRGLRQYAGEERTGRDFYWGLQAPFKSRSEAESFGISKEDYWLPNDERASKMLREAGIPGLKYLDGDSRAAGEGTSNYVIFDDSLINIAERGNADPRLLAGTAAGTAGLGGAAAMMSPEDDWARRVAEYQRAPEVRAVGAPGAYASLLSAQLHNHDLGVDENMRALGIDPREDPMYDYGALLPVRTNIASGETEMAMPSFLRDMVRGLFDIAESRKSGVFRPDGLLEVL
jgi:hypothetical protein